MLQGICQLMLVTKKMQCHLGGLYKVHDLLRVLLTLVHFARLIITEGKGWMENSGGKETFAWCRLPAIEWMWRMGIAARRSLLLHKEHVFHICFRHWSQVNPTPSFNLIGNNFISFIFWGSLSTPTMTWLCCLTLVSLHSEISVKGWECTPLQGLLCNWKGFYLFCAKSAFLFTCEITLFACHIFLTGMFRWGWLVLQV